MDRLSDIPPNENTVKTSEETELINQFFPGGAPPGSGGFPPQKSGGGPPLEGPPPDKMLGVNSPTTLPPSRLNWKLIGLSAILFVSLANPWIDSMFCKIPYCGDNAVALLGVKALLFALLLVVFSLFL